MIEPALFSFLKHKVLETPEILFHSIGGTENHIHLVVSVPPTIQVSDWIGKLKGASSHYINHEIANRKALEWQDGYGVVSFGTKDIKWVVRYVENQKEHHARGKTFERLEKTVRDDN
jgi:putative transposase